MNDKELNLAILAELNNFAKRVFKKLTITPGTYTASQIAKQINQQKEIELLLKKNPEAKVKKLEFSVCFDDVNLPDCTIEVGNFKCTIPAISVFHAISRFEKVAGERNKVRFTRLDKYRTNYIGTFELEIEKKHFDLMEFVSNDLKRPVLMQIYVDTKRCCLIATNAYIIKEIPANMEFDGESPDLLTTYIDPKNIKGMLGKNTVDVYNNQVIYTNHETGNCFINESIGRYPNYTSVFPKLNADGFVKFEENEVKTIAKFVKNIRKSQIIPTLKITEGEKFAVLRYEDLDSNNNREVQLELEQPANITIKVTFDPKYLYAITKDWNGGMWLVDPCRLVVFDCNNATIGGIMPKYDSYTYFAQKSTEYTIDPYERHSEKVKAETIKPKKADTVELSEQPDYLPAVPVETSANVIPHIYAIQAITDVFMDIVKAAMKEKAKSKRTANIWTIIQAINAACKIPIFGECRITTVENTVKAEGRKSSISNKAVLKPCNELSGGMRVIVRNGAGIAPAEKETRINAGLLIHLYKANGIHRIRDGTMLHKCGRNGMECITNKMNDDGNSFDMYNCLLCGRA